VLEYNNFLKLLNIRVKIVKLLVLKS